MSNEILIYAIVILAIIVFGALIVSSSFSNGMWGGRSPKATNNSIITISASGTVTNTSSQAVLYVTMNGTGLTNQLAVHNISATLSAFNSTILKYVNGNLSMISTSYFNVYKLYNASGYVATESDMVTIPNINNVSGVISALSNIPYVYVSSASPQLSSAQVSAMRISALSLALSNATSQARALIGPNDTIYATNISVNNYYVYPFPYAAGGVASPGTLNSNVNITPQFYGGTNRVVESVTVVFTYGKKQ